MAQLVEDFVKDAYQLISASSPTVPLHGTDSSKGLQILNEVLNFYSATGMLAPIPIKVAIPVTSASSTITAGLGAGFDIQTGRLASVMSVYLTKDNVDYALREIDRFEFYSSYKFAPLTGLPYLYYIEQQIESTDITLYPGPETGYTATVVAKQQFTELTSTDTMAIVPDFYIRFLRFAVARDLAVYKGRAEAWTPMLENMYKQAKIVMEGASRHNMNINTSSDVELWGAARVRAGI